MCVCVCWADWTKFWKLIVFGVRGFFLSLQPLHFSNEEQATASENIYMYICIISYITRHPREWRKKTRNTNEENNYIPIAVCNFLLRSPSLSVSVCLSSFGFLRGISRLSNAFGRNAGTISCVCVLIWILALQEWNHFFYLFRRFYFGNLNCCCFYYFTVLCFLFLFFYFSLSARARSFADRFYRWTLNWCSPFVNLYCVFNTNIYSPLPFAQRKKQTFTYSRTHTHTCRMT